MHTKRITLFQVLGPLLVRSGAAAVQVQARQQRMVLAVLLAEAGRVVSTDRLTDELWPDRPPKRAANAVQAYVLRLRRLLGPGASAVLATRGRGYQLVIDDEDIDANEFTRLVASGQAAASEGRWDSAADALTRAVAMWRGAALADMPTSPTVSAWATHLEQLRLTAVEAGLRAQLQLGRHAEVVDDLRRLVDAHPLREGLRAHLMLALYRCGRRAEALEAFREGRRLLVTELGMEPGQELQELQQAILTDAAHLSPRTGRPVIEARIVPAQLPPDVLGFTGRVAELQMLDGLLEQRNHRSTAVVVCTVNGREGVGKTALAVYWSHLVRDRFPDGQLYVNLRGYATGQPARPVDALTGFLTALGMRGDDVPVHEEQAAALYRSLLAGRRMLVLLDNASHPDQVRPLLPASPGCLVLVTSRDRLRGLTVRDGAIPLTLDGLDLREAMALLAVMLGPRRVNGEADAAAELVRLCGHLPLAIRIAAANLATDPDLPLALYPAELAGGHREVSSVDDEPHAGVRAAFDRSYTTFRPGPWVPALLPAP